jgi:hypothetical protein
VRLGRDGAQDGQPLRGDLDPAVTKEGGEAIGHATE